MENILERFQTKFAGNEEKEVILVDHNERSQAVDNIEAAEILEIIDHHRIGSIETMFRLSFVISRWAVLRRLCIRCMWNEISKFLRQSQGFYAQRLFLIR